MDDILTAALVSSPFQALCALEALKYFNCNYVDFYTIEDAQNTAKIRTLLSDNGIALNVLQPSKNTASWYREHFGLKRYTKLIVGDIFSFPLLILTSIMAKYKSQVIFVDDGNSTLTINNGSIPKYTKSLKWRLAQSLLCLKNTEKVLFTIYPIEHYRNMTIITNTFKTLTSDICEQQPLGVYIIGTNTSMLNIDRDRYQSTLLQIKKYYKSEMVWYCPHRRDANCFADFCISNKIKMYDTRVSVEYDFIQQKNNPKIIIGFGSTALCTLKKIYPFAEIYNVHFETSDIRIAKAYEYISVFLKSQGVLTCSMDYWHA